MNLLPGSCGRGQASGQSDARPMEGIVLVYNGAVQRSDGQARAERPYPPSDQRVRHRRRWWLSHAAMSILPLKRRTDSAPAPPGAPGLFCGFRIGKRIGHHRAPNSPQIFRSSLKAFPVRSSLIPIGGALCRLCALYGGVGRIVTAWQRHGRSGGTGRLSA